MRIDSFHYTLSVTNNRLTEQTGTKPKESPKHDKSTASGKRSAAGGGVSAVGTPSVGTPSVGTPSVNGKTKKK
jgi:hypothetical protein